MKILLITEFFPVGPNARFSGGVEARTYYVAKHLAKNNHVTILASRVPGAVQSEHLGKISVLRVGPVRSYSASVGNVIARIRFVKEAIVVANQQDIEIVDGGNFIAHFIAKVVSYNKKIPAVAWYPDVWIGSWIKNAGIQGIFGEVLERINLALGFNRYIAISKQTKQKLTKYTKGKIEVIPCGIEEIEFKNKTKKNRQNTVITISRLAKYKNIKDILLALALLNKESSINANLIIIGTGPEFNSLKNLAKQLHLTTKVKLYSNIPRKDLLSLLKSSHVFCLPSEVEGFGISVIEAAAAGVPYVISDIDVFREITKNGQGGKIARLGDVYDLKEKIEELLTDKALYIKKGKEAISLSKNYSWQKIAKRTEDVYKKTLKNV